MITEKKKDKCEFLTAKHKWTAPGSCTPKDYLAASGRNAWTFNLKVKLSKGVYHLWERATDNKQQTTKNTASKYVWFRIK